MCVYIYTIRHTLTDTKTSESLDKLPARKSIGHSRWREKGARKDRNERCRGRRGNRGCHPSMGDREGARGVKDRIHPRLVPVLFALIAPRYNSTLPGDPPETTPNDRDVRSNKRRSVRASIILIWRASMRRKRETGRAWQLLNGSVDVVKVAV